jgi:hypothetical protein
MPHENNVETPLGPAAPPPSGRNAGAPQDLSAEVVASVDRRPGDIVRCTWVGGDRYRCNWWAAESTAAYDNPAMGGLLVTTHRVRQSQFLRVERAPAGKLVIRVLPARPG